MSLFDSDQDDDEVQKGMSDDELCAFIEDCKRNAIGYRDQLRDDRQTAMDYYMGEAKGDLSPPEVDGRSKVVSRDLMDTIEWIMPSMMRIFTGTENVVSFEPTKAGQEDSASRATTYCHYTLHKRNRGFNILHDAIKAALIQRVSWCKVWSEIETEEKQEHYNGISQPEFDALSHSDAVSVLDVQESVDEFTQQPCFNVTVMRSMEKKVTKIVGVPQEEMFVDGHAKDDDSVTCIIHERDMTVSDLIALGYSQDECDEIPTRDHSTSGDEFHRKHAVGVSADMGDKGKGAMRRITLQECYLKVDADGDGVAEWRMVHKAANKILMNDYCDGHPFVACSAILMPYSYVGLSQFDLVRDVMRIKTALQRQLLDNMFLINNARTEVVEGQVNLDDLLNPRPGGVVRVKREGAMREIMPTPVADQALASINYFDHVRQVRTGVTEYASATNADSISKSSGVAVDMLQSAAKERIELMARVIAENFITRLYRLILKCALQNQDSYDQIYIGGQQLDIDPREWQEQYNMTVSVGLGTQSRAAQVAQWQQVMQAQQQLLPLGIVRPDHIANAAKSMIEAMGHKDYARYMVDPTKEQIPPPQPPPDPNAGKMQIEQMKIQTNHQLEMQRIELEAQAKERDQVAQMQQNQHQQQLEAQREELQKQRDYQLQVEKERHGYAIAQLNNETERYKIDKQSDTQIMCTQISAQTAITPQQLQAEQAYDNFEGAEQ